MMKKETKMKTNIIDRMELATKAMREYEHDLRAEVKYSKRGATITLQYNGRVIKLVRKKPYITTHFNIKENGKVIMRDLFESVDDIRFLFALGKI